MPNSRPTFAWCCPSGWQTVYCGSKFCTPAESRYHPIEGEALAATYGLQKCKFFVLGLENLILTLDHKPLLAIFGQNQHLEDIENPRLLNFKLKSQLFSFKVVHVPGKKNVTADTFSRRNDSPNVETRHEKNQSMITAMDMGPLPGYAHDLGPPDWVSPPQLVATINLQQESSHGTQNLHKQLQPLPRSLVNLHTVPDACETQLHPEHVLVGHIMSSLATVNSWSRQAPITADEQPEALSWKKLEAAWIFCDEYKRLVETIRTGSVKKEGLGRHPHGILPAKEISCGSRSRCTPA